MNPGIPAQPDEVFSKPPYSQLAIGRKLKAGGKFTNAIVADLFGPVREKKHKKKHKKKHD